jgi:hypothetical protein
MSKLIAVILTAAICLPLGAVLQGSASADRRQNGLAGDVAIRHRTLLGRDTLGDGGYANLFRAQVALHDALDAIEASERNNEGIWSDSTGRATATREAIERAVQSIDQTTAWVTNGLNANDERVKMPRFGGRVE